MVYEAFKVKVREALKVSLLTDLRGYELKKGKGNKDYLQNAEFGANIDYQYMYLLYQTIGDWEKFIKTVVSIYKKALNDLSSKNVFLDNVVMNLVNTDRNKNTLSQIPHTDVLDLSITFRYILHKQETCELCSIVSNTVMEYLGCTNEELYEAAAKNMERLMPIHTEEPFGSLFTVLSCGRRINGAIAMLDMKSLANVADKMGADLYIVPSSIHEVIALPAIDGPEEMRTIIRMVNGDERVIKPDEVLSNNLYYYDQKTKTLSIAK